MNRHSRYAAASAGLLLLASLAQTRVALADTGDIVQDIQPGLVACQDFSIGQFVDVDGDFVFETLVVMITAEGEAEVFPDAGSGQTYFFGPLENDCNVGGQEVGRVVIRFVDAAHPSFVPNDPGTWVYTNLPATSLRVFNNFAPCNPDPYIQVRAYRVIQQNQEIAGTTDASGFVYQYSDAVGVQEITIRTDYCENTLSEFVLYETQQNFSGEAPDPEVVVLMDTSGSMRRDHNGTPNVPVDQQRITLARNAVEPFLVMLRDHYAGLATFGVAAFPDNQAFNYCSGYEARGLDVVSTLSIDDAIDNTLPGLPVQGSTPLLGGIDTALDMFATAGDKAIVLLSDGYHNCPGPVANTDPAVTDLIAALDADGVSLHAVGFGLPADIDDSLLGTLSAQTSGQFYPVTGVGFDPATFNPAVVLQETYKNIAVDTLGLESIVDPIATIGPGARATHEIKLNPLDTKVTFFLSWETPRAKQLQFSLYDSFGARVPSFGRGIRYSSGDNWQLLTLDESYLRGRIGKAPWRMIVSADKFGGRETETYQYSVVGRSDLEFTPIVHSDTFAPGALLTLLAQLSADGKPVPALTGVAVEILAPPVEGRGERTATRLTLRDDGRGGDARARDGIYTAAYPTSKQEGSYTFNFTADGTVNNASFERYVRINRTLSTPLPRRKESFRVVGK